MSLSFVFKMDDEHLSEIKTRAAEYHIADVIVHGDEIVGL